MSLKDSFSRSFVLLFSLRLRIVLSSVLFSFSLFIFILTFLFYLPFPPLAFPPHLSLPLPPTPPNSSSLHSTSSYTPPPSHPRTHTCRHPQRGIRRRLRLIAATAVLRFLDSPALSSLDNGCAYLQLQGNGIFNRSM